MLLEDFLIEAAEEIDGIEIFASAKFVWNPFALFARIVEIQHGGDGVHPQAVDMVFVEPKHRARHQEAAHFGASVVEDVRLPVGMKSLAASRRVRTDGCHRNRPAHAHRKGNGMAPSPESRRYHAGAGSRPDT